mgnify:CR=1 FL=1
MRYPVRSPWWAARTETSQNYDTEGEKTFSPECFDSNEHSNTFLIVYYDFLFRDEKRRKEETRWKRTFLHFSLMWAIYETSLLNGLLERKVETKKKLNHTHSLTARPQGQACGGDSPDQQLIDDFHNIDVFKKVARKPPFWFRLWKPRWRKIVKKSGVEICCFQRRISSAFFPIFSILAQFWLHVGSILGQKSSKMASGGHLKAA